MKPTLTLTVKMSKMGRISPPNEIQTQKIKMTGLIQTIQGILSSNKSHLKTKPPNLTFQS